jgi:hypothetical protein
VLEGLAGDASLIDLLQSSREERLAVGPREPKMEMHLLPAPQLGKRVCSKFHTTESAEVSTNCGWLPAKEQVA